MSNANTILDKATETTYKLMEILETFEQPEWRESVDESTYLILRSLHTTMIDITFVTRALAINQMKLEDNILTKK